MIREGGKPGEVVPPSQNQEAERNWTDLLYKRNWAVSGAVQWRGIRPPEYRNRVSTEDRRELCLSSSILQVREEASATAGKLFAVSELALVSKTLFPQLL